MLSCGDGVILDSDRSRSCIPAYRSGRLPIHVNTENHPTTESGGVDLRMQTVAEVLRVFRGLPAAFAKYILSPYVLDKPKT